MCHVCMMLPEEDRGGVRSGAESAGNHEPSDVDAGNHTEVLLKSNTCS